MEKKSKEICSKIIGALQENTPSNQNMLPLGTVLKDRWELKKRIGSGGFGEIYEAKDLHTRKPCAVKTEPSVGNKQVLRMEVVVLKRLQGVKQACRFLGCGRTDKANFMVMSLLGPNLSELRKRQPQQKFSVGTTMRLGIQILNAVQAIHQCGFIHRDLKPSNFAMGRQPEDCKTCYVLDFGLARQYTTLTGELRQPRPVAGFRGTVRYASVNAHFGHELGRHDDLWSVFYLMVELITGALPWKKIRNKEEAGEFKQGYDHKKLIAGFPAEFKNYLDHIKNLTYYDKPNYYYLISLFEQALNRIKVSRTDPFEWEREQSTPSGTSVSGLTVPFGSVDNPDLIIHQHSNVNLMEEQYHQHGGHGVSTTDNEQAKTDVPAVNRASDSASGRCHKSRGSDHAKNEENSPVQQRPCSSHSKDTIQIPGTDTIANENPVDLTGQLSSQPNDPRSPVLRHLPVDPEDYYANKPQRAFQHLKDVFNDAANTLLHQEDEDEDKDNAVHHLIENTKQLFVFMTATTTTTTSSNKSGNAAGLTKNRPGGSNDGSEEKMKKEEIPQILLHPPTDPTKDAPFLVPQPPTTPPPPGYFCSSGRRRKFVKAGTTKTTTSANWQQQ